jgi:hypothetical protein
VPSLNLGIVASSYEVPLPVVSGGTLSSDATYYYRTFTANGNLVISNASLSMDVLLWGGGAGGQGGRYYEGGNGGGGGYYNQFSAPSRDIGTYSVVVGAGGAGGNGSEGSHSGIFASVSGRGIQGWVVNFFNQIVFAPAYSGYYDYQSGFGGGGANGNGQFIAFGGIGSNGGIGLNVWGTTRGKGGNGGEGVQVYPRTTQNANPNTSDGGDGPSAFYWGNFPARNGGSGVVIVRYLRSAVGG